ncbi:MAG: CocE/NonD family hydrolase [Planctomycetes bacterium]|nr:CocE/NonD family hydrolase [Planctomycetota bacterium]
MAKRPSFGVNVKLDLGCPADDGVRLSTDVYLPDGQGPWPCILIRTPYNNNDAVKKIPLARDFARNGYAVVIQDVRGRYDSGGDWDPFFNEQRDGLAAQKWLAGQSFCNGKIALYGRSYEGFCVWMGTFGHHPAVKAIIPIVALPDPVVNVPWQNGSVFWNMITWALFVHGRTNQDVGQYDWESIYNFRPLDKLDERLGFSSRMWQDWMKHPTRDEYWQRACYMHRMAELDVPALHIGGWYDDDGPSTYNNYPNARRLAASKDEQYVLIGPWPHATNTKTVVPGVDFGPHEIIDINDFILDWLDKQIGERPQNWGDRKRARIFLMGENRWHDFDDWPPPKAKETSLYLASGGKANSYLGDGQLLWHRFAAGESQPCATTVPAVQGEDAVAREEHSKSSGTPTRSEQDGAAGFSPRGAAFDEYTYDPDHPAPYLYDAGTLQLGGPFDARPVQRRDDVLCYTTAPLDEDVVICGRVFAELWVSTSAEDTEFCGMLCDVHPNGEARQLYDGNVRLALRDSLEKPDPVPPGEIAKVRIDMWATGIRVLKGHSIRLQVSSSAVPKFSAHTNTLDPPGTATEAVVAQNRVYHEERWPSRLLIPVVPD